MKRSEEKTWFKDWFNTQEYLDLYKHRDQTDAAKIVSLLFRYITLAPGSRVLDLACGSGRHSVLFARKGFAVTGIDLSRFLIGRANQKKRTEYLNCRHLLTFETGDMRNIQHQSEFDLTVNLFSSFGYFDSESDNQKVLKSVSKALKPNGYFLFDFLNKEYVLKNLVPFDARRENGKLIVQIRDITDGFVRKNILIVKNSPSRSKSPVVNRYMEKIRLYSYKDFKRLFEKFGLRILKTFGNYDGETFSKRESERLIILAEKI